MSHINTAFCSTSRQTKDVVNRARSSSYRRSCLKQIATVGICC